ncbi:MAG TPA: GvpL/GvpF family gas vesicle protein [Pyrinomonadaceae bacterium]|nr:GvpL/GvpF family gas vesicle protein [Pyrinomonadaceae bacterium]
MSLYVYCVSDEVTGEALAGTPGLAGAPVRLFERAGLAAVVSPFEEEPVPVTREHALAHNRVNAVVLARTTPLPFRFGTLADGERLASYLESREAALRAALAAVRGCVEMSVKLMWDAAVARRGAGAAAGGEQGGAPAPAGGGTAFLLAKRRELLGDEDLRRRADELAAWLELRTSDLARASDVRVRPSASLVVRAAHLVARARVGEYRDRLRALRAERPDLRFLTSGPWPPYSFGSIKN